MNCPKCGFVQNDGSLECTKCGIIFSKYKAVQTDSEPAVSNDSPGAQTASQPAYSSITATRREFSAFSKSVGIFLFLFGTGSAILSFFEREFVILFWIDTGGKTLGWIIRVAMIVGGLVLWTIEELKEDDGYE